MTCLEKYFKDHPGDFVVGCPYDYGYLGKPKECYSINCFKDCWPRVIPDEINHDEGEDDYANY